MEYHQTTRHLVSWCISSNPSQRRAYSFSSFIVVPAASITSKRGKFAWRQHVVSTRAEQLPTSSIFCDVKMTCSKAVEVKSRLCYLSCCCCRCFCFLLLLLLLLLCSNECCTRYQAQFLFHFTAVVLGIYGNTQTK